MWPDHKPYFDDQGTSRMQNDLNSYLRIGHTQSTKPGMLRTATSKTTPISVGIVGAGFAGLRCADILLQHGCKVTILEARNRLGGRVAQSNQLGHVVDLGPNWIHGTNDNPIMTLAKATDTQLHEWEESMTLVNTDGSIIKPDETHSYAVKLWEDVIPKAFKYSHDNQNSIDAQKSLYEFFVERADTMFKDDPAEEADRKRKTLLHIARFWGAYVGSPVTRQSLRFFWLEECIEGENPFVAGTYSKILDAVKKRADEDAEIKLNTEVTRIHSRHPSTPESTIGVETADGLRHEFDEVVVTTPLGWLKRNMHVFNPELPPRLTQAIENISYGMLDKVYITFPSAFWDQNSAQKPPTTNGIDPNHESPNLRTTTIPLHQAPSEDKPHHHSSSTHWLTPNYAPETNPERWDFQAMNMAALPNSCAKPMLLFYTYGPCSEHIAKLVATVESKQALDKELQALFEPCYSRLPNFDSANPDCTPKAFLATAWAGDKFAGYGSYANFQVGLEKGDEDIENMRHGVPERGLWLAGEHTSPFVALGTATGAYMSGEGVAKRIAQAYGLENKE